MTIYTIRWALLIAFLLIIGAGAMICSANFAVSPVQALPKSHYGNLAWAEPEELKHAD